MAHFTDLWDSSRHLGYLNPVNVPPTDDLVTHGPSVSDALTSGTVEPFSGGTAECRPRFHESIKWATKSAYAIEVEFVTQRAATLGRLDENGGRHRLTQMEYACHRTGRNATTDRYTLAVAVHHRRTGPVRFDADLWRPPFELGPAAIARLYRHWHDLNSEHCLPKRVLRRMECHFGKSPIVFDATAEQVDERRESLTVLLSDAASYVLIRESVSAPTDSFGTPARGVSIL